MGRKAWTIGTCNLDGFYEQCKRIVCLLTVCKVYEQWKKIVCLLTVCSFYSCDFFYTSGLQSKANRRPPKLVVRAGSFKSGNDVVNCEPRTGRIGGVASPPFPTNIGRQLILAPHSSSAFVVSARQQQFRRFPYPSTDCANRILSFLRLAAPL